jgi:hypothetical protein
MTVIKGYESIDQAGPGSGEMVQAPGPERFSAWDHPRLRGEHFRDAPEKVDARGPRV